MLNASCDIIIPLVTAPKVEGLKILQKKKENKRFWDLKIKIVLEGFAAQLGRFWLQKILRNVTVDKVQHPGIWVHVQHELNFKHFLMYVLHTSS